jgi:hypothetical protein
VSIAASLVIGLAVCVSPVKKIHKVSMLLGHMEFTGAGYAMLSYD